MNTEYQDRIDDYLLHRMSAEDRTAFEEEVESDEELQQQLSFTEDVMHAMKSRNEKLAKMAEWQKDYEWKDGEKKRRTFYWVSGIAAALIVGFFLMKNLYVADSPSEYMASPGINEIAVRAGSDNSDIVQLLNQEKYTEALDLIMEKSQKLKTDSVEVVQNEAIDEERREYELLVVKDKHDELKWLKVHALLGLHRDDDAILLLDELRNAEGSYQLLADSLYKHIK